jgi:protein-S-isoprenylcysteine O-methyltransferase Ste14
LTWWTPGWLVLAALLLAAVAPVIAGRKSGLSDFPAYTRVELGWLRLQLLDLLVLVFASLFTPFAAGTGWIAGGLVVCAAGAALYLLALRAFGQTPARQLVTHGVFRLNRNPIYSGQTLMLLGAGIAGASLLLIALGAGFGLLADRLVRAEERMCTEAFGDAYREYAARVPRWMGVWRT